MEWFWLWAIFVVLFLLLPIGYGWGYRGWGPPYPRGYAGSRRRSVETRSDLAADNRVELAEEATWGALAAVVWVTLAIAVVWLIVGWLY